MQGSVGDELEDEDSLVPVVAVPKEADDVGVIDAEEDVELLAEGASCGP